MRKTNTQDEFIIQAKQIYGNTYDYSNIEYINIHSKIKIICKYHGSFIISPYLHLQGRECLKCSINNLKPKNQRLF